MVDRLTGFIIDESNWMPVSMSLAFISTILLLYRYRNSSHTRRDRILASMNLFFGATIGTMALGHLSAVTAKHLLGTLQGSLFILYPIGALLILPSGWLVYHTWKAYASAENQGRFALILNAWLAITLMALGIHNLPLALPALFNIAYGLHSRRSVGWAIVCLAIVIIVGLFVGALMFMASGQSFEEFSRME